MYEYTISAGEGTLIEYGIADDLDDVHDIMVLAYLEREASALVAVCVAAPDCVTGE